MTATPQRDITLADVQNALALPDFDVAAARQAQMRMAPVPRPQQPSELTITPKEAGVLALLFPQAGQLHFALIRRTEAPGVHGGQMSFPGGRRESDESYLAAALREADEEVGAKNVAVLGQLNLLYVPPSNFLIQPVVGYVQQPPQWQLSPQEVVEVVEVPLHWLHDDQLKGSEQVERVIVSTSKTLTMQIPYYKFKGHKVWGATAIMLSELEVRLQLALA
jgi:8-oxo-dGTP pyrophosphatase MutT (NUDIX family)